MSQLPKPAPAVARECRALDEHMSSLRPILCESAAVTSCNQTAGYAAARMPATVSQLRLWTWQASRFRVGGRLISPLNGQPCRAGDVVAELLHLLQPVLTGTGEDAAVELFAAAILRSGPGARKQREL